LSDLFDNDNRIIAKSGGRLPCGDGGAGYESRGGEIPRATANYVFKHVSEVLISQK
jgi:hypothetical protein